MDQEQLDRIEAKLDALLKLWARAAPLLDHPMARRLLNRGQAPAGPRTVVKPKGGPHR